MDQHGLDKICKLLQHILYKDLSGHSFMTEVCQKHIQTLMQNCRNTILYLVQEREKQYKERRTILSYKIFGNADDGADEPS